MASSSAPVRSGRGPLLQNRPKIAVALGTAQQISRRSRCSTCRKLPPSVRTEGNAGEKSASARRPLRGGPIRAWEPRAETPRFPGAFGVDGRQAARRRRGDRRHGRTQPRETVVRLDHKIAAATRRQPGKNARRLPGASAASSWCAGKHAGSAAWPPPFEHGIAKTPPRGVAGRRLVEDDHGRTPGADLAHEISIKGLL